MVADFGIQNRKANNCNYSNQSTIISNNRMLSILVVFLALCSTESNAIKTWKDSLLVDLDTL